MHSILNEHLEAKSNIRGRHVCRLYSFGNLRMSHLILVSLILIYLDTEDTPTLEKQILAMRTLHYTVVKVFSLDEYIVCSASTRRRALSAPLLCAIKMSGKLVGLRNSRIVAINTFIPP